MPRYQIIGIATDLFPLADIRDALEKEGAQRVNIRHAFGWSNQPRVATFAAADDRAARDLCERARVRLNHPSSRLAFQPYPYRPSSLTLTAETVSTTC